MSLLAKIAVGVGGVVLLLVVALVVALATIDPNEYRGLVADTVKEATGRELAVEGDLKLEIGLPVAISVENVRFANAEWGARPYMATAQRAAAEVKLLPLIKGDIHIVRLVVEGVDVLLEIDKNGRKNWELASDKEPKGKTDAGRKAGVGAREGKSTLPAISEVDIRDVTVTYMDASAGKTTTAVLDSLYLQADSFESPLQLAIAAKVDGAGIAATGTVGPLAYLMQPGKSYPLSLQVSALGAKLAVNGTIAEPLKVTGIDLSLHGEGRDVAKEAGAIGLSLPPIPPFSVTGKLSDAEHGYVINDLDLKLGGSDLKGSVQVAAEGSKPQVVATLSSSVLDLNDLGGGEPARGIAVGGEESGAPKSGQKGRASGRVFSDDPLPLDGLDAVNADVTLKVASLLLAAGIAAEQVTIEADLQDGRLVAKPHIGAFAGGSVSGEIHAAAKGAVKADIVIKGVVGGKLLKALAITDILDGAPADAFINVTGIGSSTRQMMSGLNGSVRIVLGQGRINNKALGIAGGDAFTQLTGAINPFSKNDTATTLKCGVVRAPIRNGLMTFDNTIGIETDKMNILGAGAVNLKSETLDLGFRTDAQEGLGLSVAEFAAKFVRVTGSFSNPSVGVDATGSIEGIAKLGVTAGAAVASGGISLLAPSILAGAKEDSVGAACQVALGKAPASKKDGAGASTPSKQSTPETVIEGIGKGIKGLFGN